MFVTQAWMACAPVSAPQTAILVSTSPTYSAFPLSSTSQSEEVDGGRFAWYAAPNKATK